VVAKVTVRLTASKQVAQRFDMKIFNFRKLNDVNVKGQHQVKMSNRFAALEKFGNDDVESNSFW
jgi:hypothetical protein